MARLACASISAAAALSIGCASTALTQDGQLVVTPGAEHGATVLTANGIEYHDKTYRPPRVIRTTANEPWRPATGFLLPAGGVWRETSTPAYVNGRGLAITLRASDTLVPAWGGEILVRVDVSAPPAGAAARAAERLVVVLDGHDENGAALVRRAFEHAGASDRVALVDSAGGRLVMPPVPGGDRTLLEAGLANARGRDDRERDLPAALELAGFWAERGEWQGVRHVLVVTDGKGASGDPRRLSAARERLEAAGVRLDAFASADRFDPALVARVATAPHVEGTFFDRLDALDRAIPPPGPPALDRVTLAFDAAPAPARVLEVSGGDARWSLETDALELGELHAGEARTEVLRVSVPSFVPGEPFRFRVLASWVSVRTGLPERAVGEMEGRYSDDIEKLADERHGDVIAYASALATLRRLDAAFAGAALDRLGGLRGLAKLQAESLSRLAERTHDRALAEQAETLSALLGTTAE